MARLIDKEEKQEPTSTTLPEQEVKQETESVTDNSNLEQNVQALSNQNPTVAISVKKHRFKVHPNLITAANNSNKTRYKGTVLEYEHAINKDATIDYDFRSDKFTVFPGDKTQYSICECDDFTTSDGTGDLDLLI
jgi:hypothetical protein